MSKVYHAGPRGYTASRPKPSAVPELRDRWARAVLADPDLGDHVTRTAWALREYVNRAGECSVSLGRLASDVAKDRRNVRRHIAELVDRGYLERVPGKGVPGRGGRTALTLVRIPVDNPATCPQLDKQAGAPVVKSGGAGRPPNPSLNPKSATGPAPRGGAVAQEGKTPAPPLQRQLPGMLGDVQKADPVHVAESLKRIRSHLGNRASTKRGREDA